MAPIQESDQAESRWETAEWSRYELWEKVEIRLRRRRWVWISITVVAFFMLSAVPVWQELSPKWKSLREARRLADQINAFKRQAIEKQIRLRLTAISPTELEIRRVDQCRGDEKPSDLGDRSRISLGSDEVRFLTPETGDKLGIPGVTNDYCFSPWSEDSAPVDPSAPKAVFGLIPPQDLDANSVTGLGPRNDRISLVVIDGGSEEPRFE